MKLETLGILFFFGCVILGLALCLIHENKSVKRFWKWRDGCLNELEEIKVYLKTLAEQSVNFNNYIKDDDLNEN